MDVFDLFIFVLISAIHSLAVLRPQLYKKTASSVSALFSQSGFQAINGGRPGAAKVMVVVTDGESHDQDIRDAVISQCEKQGITRFGIAVRPLPFTNPYL